MIYWIAAGFGNQLTERHFRDIGDIVGCVLERRNYKRISIDLSDSEELISRLKEYCCRENLYCEETRPRRYHA